MTCAAHSFIFCFVSLPFFKLTFLKDFIGKIVDKYRVYRSVFLWLASTVTFFCSLLFSLFFPNPCCRISRKVRQRFAVMQCFPCILQSLALFSRFFEWTCNIRSSSYEQWWNCLVIILFFFLFFLPCTIFFCAVSALLGEIACQDDIPIKK